MEIRWPVSPDTLLRAALALLAVALVLTAFLLWREYRVVRQVAMYTRVEWMGALPSGDLHGPRPSPEVLRPWMTFEYINRIFSLPPDLLSHSLSIADARYPKLTVAAYARMSGFSADAVITRIAVTIEAWQSGD